MLTDKENERSSAKVRMAYAPVFACVMKRR